MRITFLGTSGGLLVKGRSCPGILIDNTLLDCGFGVLKNLRDLDIPLNTIKRIAISHAHADHCSDFAGILWAMALEARKTPLQIIASPSTTTRLKTVLDAYGTNEWLMTRFPIEWRTPEQVGLKYCRGIHVPEDYAYKLVDGSKSVVYTGDTAMSSSIAELAKNATLLIHESTFRDKDFKLAKAANHVTASQAAVVAKTAGVKRLVLTHFSMIPSDIPKALAEAKRVFPNTIAAKDGMIITV